MVRSKKPIALIVAVVLGMTSFAPAVAVIEAEEAFYNTWARTDLPVAGGAVQRTWMWGPGPNTTVIAEPYAEHPIGERPVQYYDKARMEVNDPNVPADEVDLWYVTNGLMVVELVTGMMQVGHAGFEERAPADVNITGDQADPFGPTYAAINQLGLSDMPAQTVGETITDTYTQQGEISADSQYAAHGVTAAHRVQVPGIDHTVASVFWDFMNSEGVVHVDGQNVTDRLFVDPFYATGYPITGAYWSLVAVGGITQDVLWQCFERRCLTYTHQNEPGWQVEAGNVGLHYYQWRYDGTPPPPGRQFHVLFGRLNSSLVSGSALLTLDESAGTLTVAIEVGGLEPNQPHEQAIHGFDDLAQSLCPTPAAGHDGRITYDDGLLAHGLPLHHLGPTPTADQDGNVSFSQTLNLDDLAFPVDVETLTARAIVLNGKTIEGGYEPDLPVACGLITPDVGFVADLSGESAVPFEDPPVDTSGSGFVTFQFPGDPTQLAFNLAVTDVWNITLARVWVVEDTGVSASPAVTLFDRIDESGDDPTAYFNGIVASGIFGDLNFTGPLQGMPMTALIDAIDEGRAYVLVHTLDHPFGEIRGTIERFVDR